MDHDTGLVYGGLVGSPAAGEPPGPMRSLSHGLGVLTILTQAGEPVSLADLADRTGLHRSTIHRILSTFIEYGLVRRNHEPKYSIGLAALELARAAGYASVSDPVSQEITELHLRTRARATYSVPRFGHMTCVVASERGEVSFPIVPQYSLLPLHSTAAGKAYLAYRPEGEVERFLHSEPFPKSTPHTTTTATGLRRMLNTVRACGHATEFYEFSPRGRAIGVPVRDRNGIAVASVALGLPDGVQRPDQAARLVQAATTTADQIADVVFGRSIT